jgi:regulatory protein
VSGTITKIRKTGGDTPRVTVFVDGVKAFTVSEEVARELGLSVGREMVPAAAERLTSNDEQAKAREAALRLLAVRARSEGELVDRLRRKGFRDELTATVVASLAEVGLVDDEAFARAWADEKVRLRPTGPRRLTQDLISKRIDRQLIARVVAETVIEHSELELARRAL